MGLFDTIMQTHKGVMMSTHMDQILKAYKHNAGIGMSHGDNIWIILGPYFEKAIWNDKRDQRFYELALFFEKGEKVLDPSHEDLKKALLEHIRTFREFLKQIKDENGIRVYDNIEKAGYCVLGIEIWKKAAGFKHLWGNQLLETLGYKGGPKEASQSPKSEKVAIPPQVRGRG